MVTSNADNSPRVSDKELELLGDDPVVWRMAYERSPELQQEFLDFGCFEAYLKGFKSGRSSVCRGPVVRSSDPKAGKTYLAN